MLIIISKLEIVSQHHCQETDRYTKAPNADSSFLGSNLPWELTEIYVCLAMSTQVGILGWD